MIWNKDCLQKTFVFFVKKTSNAWNNLSSYASKMEVLKIQIRHAILWAFEYDKNATETTKNISCVHSQGTIIHHEVQDLFQGFVFGIRHWERNQDQDAYQMSIKTL